MNAIVQRSERTEVAQVESDSSALMTLINRAAMDSNFDVAKLEKLLEMKERYDATQARKAFVAAMTAFKSNPPEVIKRKHVSFNTSKGPTEYDHATLADVCSAAIKGLADVGISHRWDTKQDTGRIHVICVLTHCDGHSESVSLSSQPDDSGGKNSIQAIGSAITYLQRYTLLAATGLAAKDMDDDGKTGGDAEVECINEKQIADLMALAEEVKADRAKFLAYMKVEKLADITADRYHLAVKALEAKRGR